MRIRRTVALTCTSIFLMGCFLLYFMMDQAMVPQTARDHNVVDNKWLHFEDRLKQLEDGLNSHQIAVVEIKEAMKQLSPAPPQQSLDESMLGDFNDIMSDGHQKCSIRVDAAPHTDIQMLEMYKEMKFDNPDGGVWKQGFNIEYDPHQWNAQNKLKVFIVPHSHNDPGWLKTVEEYYTAQTKSILNHMLQQLTDDPTMKFIWAEISYFSIWWNEINIEERNRVKRLISNNQLEIVTGGWVMADEANSHWLNLLTQLTEGHDWVQTNLNTTPKSSWSIDPFGQSPTMPFLLKKAGMNNLLIQRIHYAVKKHLALRRELEFRWRQLWDGTGETDFLTHMMPFYSYDVPHTCGPDPKICCQFDFKRLAGYGLSCPWRIAPQRINENNVAQKAELILDQWRKKSMLYRTRTVLIPLGDDFRYDQHTEWKEQMENFEKLFDYINNKPSLHTDVKWGTLSDYFASLRAETQLSDLPSLSGDFFTYADRDDHYWSGYYTSRPLYKRMDRVLMNYVRSAELLHSWCVINKVQISDDMLVPLQKSRRALSVFQHHDGITGTARDPVVIDYAKMMIDSIQATKHVIQQSAYALLSAKSTYLPDFQFTYFEFDFEDSRLLSLSEDIGGRPTLTLGYDVPNKTIALHNSLSQHRNDIVSFYISTPYLKVFDFNGNQIACQVSPVWLWSGDIPQPSNARYELTFRAKVPPMSLAVYTIQAIESKNTHTVYSSVLLMEQNGLPVKIDNYPGTVSIGEPKPFTIKGSNGAPSIAFNEQGMLKAISLDGTMVPVHLDFATYGARQGAERSGAYLFLPDGAAQTLQSKPSSILIMEGPIESRVIVKLQYVLHETIIRNGVIEVHNLVDITQSSNFELVMRLSTNIKSNDNFFTDLNALQMIRRQRFGKLPLQANYYPMPSAMYIEDDDIRLTMLTGQPLGGSSLKSGQIEIMQDRRLNQDDNRGLGQGVLDNKPTLHIFKILLEKRKKSCTDYDAEFHPSGFLSHLANNEIKKLLHPMEKLIYTQDSWRNMKNLYSAFEAPLNSDLFVATVKSNSLDKGTNTAGFVFQRNKLDKCMQKSDDSEMEDGNINLLSVLSVKPKKIQPARITLLKPLGPTLNIQDPVNLCPMDIKGYLLDF